MLKYRASKQYAAETFRKVLEFGEARLVIMSNACAYLELGAARRPEGESPPPEESALSCAFCDRTTRHEHVFPGRVRFDPSQGKHYVSFVQVKAGSDDRRREKKSPPKPSPSLQIIPVNQSEKSGKQNAPGAARPSRPKSSKTLVRASRIFPLVTYNEADATNALLLSISEWTKDRARSGTSITGRSKVVAVKVVCSEELVLAKAELKAGATRVDDLASCEMCQTVARDSPESLAAHLDIHGLAVKVRRVPEQRMKTSEDDGTLEEPADLLCTEYREDDDKFLCRLCGETFETDEEGVRHSNDVHATKGEVPHQCPVCLQRFKTRVGFHKHRRSSHRETPAPRNHSCHLCDRRFLKPQHLKSHLQTHLGGKQHKCLDCDRSYAFESSLKAHRASAHPSSGDKETKPPPECGDCGRSFTTRGTLNKHVLERHTKDPRLRCQHCGQFFMRRDNLREHAETCRKKFGGGGGATGDGASPFKCATCGDRSFKSKDSLDRHLRSSHGVLPWNDASSAGESAADLESGLLRGRLKCKVCEHDFLSEEMESHLRFSHGVMPFRPGETQASSVSEAAEALLRTLTPQPDYLLRCLTPLPMETLDDFIT